MVTTFVGHHPVVCILAVAPSRQSRRPAPQASTNARGYLCNHRLARRERGCSLRPSVVASAFLRHQARIDAPCGQAYGARPKLIGGSQRRRAAKSRRRSSRMTTPSARGMRWDSERKRVRWLVQRATRAPVSASGNTRASRLSIMNWRASRRSRRAERRSRRDLAASVCPQVRGGGSRRSHMPRSATSATAPNSSHNAAAGRAKHGVGIGHDAQRAKYVCCAVTQRRVGVCQQRQARRLPPRPGRSGRIPSRDQPAPHGAEGAGALRSTRRRGIRSSRCAGWTPLRTETERNRGITPITVNVPPSRSTGRLPSASALPSHPRPPQPVC